MGCLVANVAAFPWQGTFPELALDANDTVRTITDALYALADETEPLTAAQFVASTSEFLGGPGFTKMGPHVLSVLRRHGLVDTSRVLEVGFGVGRVGRSIINFLAPDRFCGIEPNAQMLAAGVSRLVGRDRLRAKRPRFHLTPDGSFEVFGGRFDFVYSRSVWTHMSKRQIEAYLDGFLRVADRVGINLRVPPRVDEVFPRRSRTRTRCCSRRSSTPRAVATTRATPGSGTRTSRTARASPGTACRGSRRSATSTVSPRRTSAPASARPGSGS